MRINVLNYIASTDTLVLICDGHLITHVSGDRPQAMSKILCDGEDALCDRDVCLAKLYSDSNSIDPKDMVGMSAEHTEPRPTVRFTGHVGGLISYVYDGEEKHVHIDSLAVLRLKSGICGDDMTLDLENSLLALAYEIYILNGNTVSIIGLEVQPSDLEQGAQQ